MISLLPTSGLRQVENNMVESLLTWMVTDPWTRNWSVLGYDEIIRDTKLVFLPILMHVKGWFVLETQATETKSESESESESHKGYDLLEIKTT